ncbi:carboxypeptidase-like regulatory domain-containing protein [Maribacter sp. 2210JD10-5]|uniref:TonB-dependent receptor n=1 Tax=Maribacter sp. 2210JD10-5 TaxID=3386272 RepID=UPI0039BC6380
MNKKYFVLTYLFFLCSCFNLSSQEAIKTKPLSTILADLQQRFKVQFNYVSTLVDGISATPPKNTFNLKEAVSYLSSVSQLEFVFVSESIITLKKKQRILCGHIRDRDTNEILPFVTIQNGTAGTISNENGFFELPLNSSSNIVEIKHIGYTYVEREIQHLNTAKCSDIYLLPNQEQLAEVVVYDYLIRGIDQLDNGAYQIDFNKFSLLPGLIEDDVLQAVQALPGIQSIDETVSNINIRGGSNDQNLITWDGIKMYQSGHFFGLISMYNPQITQKVILYKNGTNASETDGVSGTIAMHTSDNINSELKGSLGVNLIDANAFIDTPLGKKASLQIAARKSISDFIETPTYSEYFNRIAQDTELEQNTETVKNSDIAFDFYDVSFRLLYHPSGKDKIRFNFIHTNNNILFNENATVGGMEEIRQSDLNQGSIAGALYYERNWSSNFDTQLSISETDYSLNASNVNILTDQRFLQKNEVSETGIKLNTNYKINENIKWANGYHFVETKVTNLDNIDNPQFLLLVGEVLQTHGIYSQLGFLGNNKKTHVNVGLRFNYLDKFKKQIWEPRLSLNHDFGKGFGAEILGEFKHQNTSQVINFQNDFLGVEKRRWQLSNNGSIPVITSKQFSIGGNYVKKGWLLNFVPFYKKVNGITTQSQGFLNNYEFVKTTGAYDALGADLLLRKQFPKVSAWLSYSYLNSTYTFNGLPEVRFPNNFEITQTFTVGANYTLKKLILAGGLNWRSGKPLTIPLEANPVTDGEINFGPANAMQQNDYLRLDISAKQEFTLGNKTRGQVGIALWNVLDRNNTINTFYRVNTMSEVQENNQSSLGITPNATFKLFF